jgi:Protein of unknown function (DUF1656)
VKEFVFAGLLITPLVRYALLTGVLLFVVRWLLVRLRFHRWFWHPLLAEAAIYICLLGTLNLFV